MRLGSAHPPRPWWTTAICRWPTLCALVALGFFLATILGKRHSGGLYIEDDAYYYLIVARNFAATGASTFDHQSLTNGYHPLWLAALVMQHLTIGTSLFAILVLQALMLAGALYLLLRLAPREHGLAQVGFTGVFALLIGSIGLKGMEVALWSLCFAVLLTVAAWAAPEPRRGVWIGLAAAVCIGARIDSAFFVVPLVVALPTGRPARASAFAVLSVLGLAYALYNLKTFGVAMPISSSIKSLGGLQINHPMLAQLSPFDPRQHARFYGLTLLALLASPLLVALSRPGTIGRALAIASTLGGALYLAKLLFLSSWILWPWYNFAILLPMAAGLLILPPYMDAAAIRLSSHVTRAGLERAGLALAIGGLGLLALGSIAAYLKPFRHDNDFAASSHQAVQLYGGLLKGARVAMGDRAGSFAAEYQGPVTQLEGLVGDKAYLEVLLGEADPRTLLCRRGVSYIISYEHDIGVYQQRAIALLRPNLTQYRAAPLTVWRQDEVAHLPYRKPSTATPLLPEDERDLYIWRLRCGDPDGKGGR
ncbi:hypothetical protein JKL49_18330 [Phenylobacterium sp. 20VBR1]|uniref:Glycosyltransferase RgtA/B/C/D-like domain-containing protein n=1 Tax=Phenylobacterium glaciei TaxID=2803784 RepID=A0A941D3S3_9CAUL|nr:hypothetical protein [Phenylobacterium glaciei]MBR7621357.1 hypothetical protein [Phenylobacterium glaciei]